MSRLIVAEREIFSTFRIALSNPMLTVVDSYVSRKHAELIYAEFRKGKTILQYPELCHEVAGQWDSRVIKKACKSRTDIFVLSFANSFVFPKVVAKYDGEELKQYKGSTKKLVREMQYAAITGERRGS